MANTWNRVWSTPFHQRIKDSVWEAAIYGERSDGKIVYVTLAITPESFQRPEHVGVDLMNALTTLDVVWKDKDIDAS